MATGLQTRHGNILQEAFKNGLQSFVNTTTNTLAATSTAGTPASGTFYSTVVGRASVVDISQDLKASFGIERIMTQQIVQLQNEFGPNGEPVFSAVNDDRGLIRFVGNWTNVADLNGQRPYPSVSGTDFVEVTFYGTGLNTLVYPSNATQNYTYSVDGGTASSSSFLMSSVLQARNYNPNCVVSIVSGLVLGTHTVKIISTTANLNFQIYGFEVLNTASTTFLNVNPGIAYVDGLKIVSSAAQSISYNSSFETGTLGTRGGHVVTYLKQDGTVGKAVTPVNAASAFLTSADHTNEEIVRTYGFREFGAGRADDFSLTGSASGSRVFTLDDGTTTLTTNGIDLANEGIIPNTTGNFIAFTFAGTGIDITNVRGTQTSSTYSFIIDGTTVASGLTGSSFGTNGTGTFKIASGLPYGTHVLKILCTTLSGAGIAVSKFTVYQPKKPSIPTGSIELSDYNAMATYSLSTNTALNGVGAISPGVLRKQCSREYLYNGTWNMGPDTGFNSGLNNNSTTAGSYFQYTFFGTGADFRTYLTTSGINWTFSIDGSSNLSATNASFNYTGSGLTFTSSTGTVSGTPSGAAGYGGLVFSVSNLILGLHTIRVSYNSGAQPLYADSFDIITPIHSAKSNINADFQNTLPVGSNSLSDNRQLSLIKATDKPRKNWVQAVGVSNNPSTTSSAPVPCPDMSVVMNTTGGRVLINYSITLYENTIANYGVLQIYIDGLPVGIIKIFEAQNTGQGYSTVSDSWIAQLSPGAHKIDVYWAASGGTTVGWSTSRTMNAAEF